MTPDPRQTALRLWKSSPLRPSLALILGSGFDSASAQLTVSTEIPYGKLPGFPSLSVRGHAGKLVIGHLGSVPAYVLCGRAHYYEGCEMAEITFPVRVLAEAGVRALLLTNAAGGIAAKFRPGDFMRIADHINLMGCNPLRGAAPAGKDRFVDLSQVYSPALGKWLENAAKQAGARIFPGVYAAVSGPSYETPAEIRAFARLGADAVGMSTVPEAIVARQCGLSVAGLSCITNLAAGRARHPISHAEVLSISEANRERISRTLLNFAELCADNETRGAL